MSRKPGASANYFAKSPISIGCLINWQFIALINDDDWREQDTALHNRDEINWFVVYKAVGSPIKRIINIGQDVEDQTNAESGFFFFIKQ